VLTQKEKDAEDATNTAMKPELEVKQAMKLPGPLHWKPPLDSEWVIDERAREGKVKAQRATELAQKAAQKRSDALAEAAKRGFNIKTGPAAGINYNGIICTKSSVRACTDIGPQPEMVVSCNDMKQECHFLSPRTKQWEIIYPTIPCPAGRHQCTEGVIKEETERWLVMDKIKSKEKYAKAGELADRTREVRKKYRLKIAANAGDGAAEASVEMEWYMTKAALKFNRPGGRYNPQPAIDPTEGSPLLRERAKTMRMRQKLGEANKLVQKLGILTLTCGDKMESCIQACDDPNRSGLRKDPDGSKCRHQCNQDVKMCMIRKIQAATAAAKAFEAARNATNGTNTTALAADAEKAAGGTPTLAAVTGNQMKAATKADGPTALKSVY